METKTLQNFLNKQVRLFVDVSRERPFTYAGFLIEVNGEDVLLRENRNGLMSFSALKITGIQEINQ